MKKTKTMAPKINPQRAPRERRMDHNTVSRPMRAKVRVLADSRPRRWSSSRRAAVRFSA